MAIIDRDRGYIFFHVPKTGGVSVAAALLEEGGRRIAQIPELASAIRASLEARGEEARTGRINHVRPVTLRAIIGPGSFEAMERVAVVRSPWGRMRSVYRYQRQRPRERVGANMRDLLALSLSEFAVRLCEQNYPPISRLLSGVDGRLLVDTTLRFESLETDFAAWSERKIGRRLPLPWLNRSTGDEGSGFDAAAVTAMRAHFAEDFERFGYSDSPPD